MQKPENLPKGAGIYLLLHEGRRLAYVGKCSNVRHRAAVWEYNFRQRALKPGHRMPVRNWPDIPGSEWQFGGWETMEESKLRQALKEQGYTFLNEKSRNRDLIEYRGRSMTLAEHAKIEKVPYSRAYYRLRAGRTLDEVFAKGSIPSDQASPDKTTREESVPG